MLRKIQRIVLQNREIFFINVLCAVDFVASPASFAPGYQLEGIPGAVAVQGIGIAFLMWNATYPLFIWKPCRWRVLGWVILAQQAIGLVGELFIASTIPAGNALLTNSIARFVGFDAIGLVIMGASFALLMRASRRRR